MIYTRCTSHTPDSVAVHFTSEKLHVKDQRLVSISEWQVMGKWLGDMWYLVLSQASKLLPVILAAEERFSGARKSSLDGRAASSHETSAASGSSTVDQHFDDVHTGRFLEQDVILERCWGGRSVSLLLKGCLSLRDPRFVLRVFSRIADVLVTRDRADHHAIKNPTEFHTFYVGLSCHVEGGSPCCVHGRNALYHTQTCRTSRPTCLCVIQVCVTDEKW